MLPARTSGSDVAAWRHRFRDQLAKDLEPDPLRATVADDQLTAATFAVGEHAGGEHPVHHWGELGDELHGSTRARLDPDTPPELIPSLDQSVLGEEGCPYLSVPKE